MKFLKLILLCSIVLAPLATAAQSSNDTVTIPRSQLTDQQKAVVEKQDLDDKIAHYGKWVGIGHEIGTAVNESLSAVTTNASTFSQTGVGKMTIALVIFKVAGRELIGLFVGLVLLIVFVPVWCWAFYKNCITRRILVEDNKQTGKKWNLINDPDHGGVPGADYLMGTRALHAAALLLLSIFVCCSIFGCN